MHVFKIDSRLKNDCIQLGQLHNIHLLLMNNSLVPWFILVPETDQIEICDLPDELKQRVYKTIDILSLFIKTHYEIDKLNLGAVGNVVSQLHIHVVGRRKDDYCWPNVVWGTNEKQSYEPKEITQIIENLKTYFDASYKNY